jgi:drug/metabolite transporter (DMT)-like permease
VFGFRLQLREWAAIVGMSAGLVCFLYALQPASGHPADVTPGGWAAGIATTIALSAVCVVTGYRTTGPRRAVFLGLATGIGFALTAVLIAGIGSVHSRSGMAGVLTWPLTYLVIVLGPSYFFLLQKTLQAGRLVAAQPALTLSDPVVAVVFGVVVFGEHVRTGGWLALAVAAAAVLVVSTIALARSPLLQESGEPPAADGPRGH